MAPVIGAIIGSGLGGASLFGQVLGGALGGGIGSVATGGKFGKGALGGALGGLLSPVAGTLASGPLSGLGAAAPYAANALLGGVTSTMQGGNFLRGMAGGVAGTGINQFMRGSFSGPSQDTSFSGGEDTSGFTGGTSGDTLAVPTMNSGGIPRLSLTNQLSTPAQAAAYQSQIPDFTPSYDINPTPSISPTVSGADVGLGTAAYQPGSYPSGYVNPEIGGRYKPGSTQEQNNPNADPYSLESMLTKGGGLSTPGGLSYQSIVAPQNSGMLSKLFGNMDTKKIVGELLQTMLSSQLLGQQQQQNDPFGPQREYYLGKLRELEANPSLITNSPEYQAAFDQGLKAISRSYAARRMGDSGNALLARQRYGQQLAAQGLTRERERLATLAGAGIAPNTKAMGQQNQLYVNALDELVNPLLRQQSTGISYAF